MNDESDIAIRVEKVSKSFRLPHQKHSSLKGMFLSSFQRNTYEKQKALKKISFEIKKGEFFGIVGRNGSGKSTLLKIIAGIYSPDSGKITVNGSLTPFIELGVGFNPELSGRDNVYLNGALLGLSRKAIDGMYDEIVDFAELERFMDQKLKNYSSGMQVRLAFSISIRAHSDILLLDEVLAVGDSAFQQKCFDYFASLKRDKKTIILVSHGMATIEQFCDRALLLEASKIKHIGSSSDVAGIYEDMMLKEEADKRELREGSGSKDRSESVEIAGISVLQGGKKVRVVEAFKDFQLVIKLRSKKNVRRAAIGANLRNSQGQMICSLDTSLGLGDLHLKKGKTQKLTIDIENIFTNGAYHVNLGVSDLDDFSGRKLARKRSAVQFSVYGVRKHEQSLVHPKNKMSFE